MCIKLHCQTCFGLLLYDVLYVLRSDVLQCVFVLAEVVAMPMNDPCIVKRHEMS